MKRDLIDHLGIYRARTIPRPIQAACRDYYTASTKAAEELERWPSASSVEGIKR
jgi:hypothetical protein